MTSGNDSEGYHDNGTRRVLKVEEIEIRTLWVGGSQHALLGTDAWHEIRGLCYFVDGSMVVPIYKVIETHNGAVTAS